MDIVELIQRGAARGVDFQHVAGIASKLDGIAKKRSRTDDERKLGLPIRDTAQGHQTRVYRRPAWSVAELGQAACGMGLIPWTAALYSFAGARDGHYLLWNALVNEAQRLAKRENWPSRVSGEDGQPQYFREALADLVLLEDANRDLFTAAPQLYWVFMKVPDIVWEKQLSEPYGSLKVSYDRWLSIARSVISRWINENH